MAKILDFPATAQRLPDLTTAEQIAAASRRRIEMGYDMLRVHLQHLPVPEKVFVAYGSHDGDKPVWHYLTLDVSAAELRQLIELVIKDLGKP